MRQTNVDLELRNLVFCHVHAVRLIRRTAHMLLLVLGAVRITSVTSYETSAATKVATDRNPTYGYEYVRTRVHVIRLSTVRTVQYIRDYPRFREQQEAHTACQRSRLVAVALSSAARANQCRGLRESVEEVRF